MKTKICTDIEQSKKLIELEIDPNTSDMYYKYILPKSDKIKHNPEVGNPVESLKWYNSGYTFSGKKDPITLEEYCIPAWSLSALLNLLPLSTTLDREINGWYCNINYDIVNIKEGHKDHTIICDNPIDAAFEMICWIMKSNKL